MKWRVLATIGNGRCQKCAKLVDERKVIEYLVAPGYTNITAVRAYCKSCQDALPVSTGDPRE